MSVHNPIEPSPKSTVRMTVMQGQAVASADQSLEMTTILGSCVATCLFDPHACVGGMNHFLLAKPLNETRDHKFDSDYGLYLMELLVNEMLHLGASKMNMKGRLYGGANINSDLAPIGTANADFARGFLKQEGIIQVFEDLEGRSARRIHFRPASGLVRCRQVMGEAVPKEKPQGPPKASLGAVELF